MAMLLQPLIVDERTGLSYPKDNELVFTEPNLGACFKDSVKKKPEVKN